MHTVLTSTGLPMSPFFIKTNTVRGRGLEPPQVTLLVPKTNASTNFATHARYLLL